MFTTPSTPFTFLKFLNSESLLTAPFGTRNPYFLILAPAAYLCALYESEWYKAYRSGGKRWVTHVIFHILLMMMESTLWYNTENPNRILLQSAIVCLFSTMWKHWISTPCFSANNSCSLKTQQWANNNGRITIHRCFALPSCTVDNPTLSLQCPLSSSTKNLGKHCDSQTTWSGLGRASVVLSQL